MKFCYKNLKESDFQNKVYQERSEGTSSVALEVLIIRINCNIEFINLFIFNCLTPNVNLFTFNYLTSNIEQNSCIWTRDISFEYQTHLGILMTSDDL